MHDYASLDEAVGIAKKAERLESVRRQFGRRSEDSDPYRDYGDSYDRRSPSRNSKSSPAQPSELMAAQEQMLQKITDATKVLDRVVLGNTEVKFKNPITEGPTSSGYALSPQKESNPSASQRIVSNRGEYLKNRGISPHQQDNRSILRDSSYQPMESDDEDKSPKLRSKTPDGYVKSGTGFLVPKAIAGQYLDRYVLKPEGESSREQPSQRQYDRDP